MYVNSGWDVGVWTARKDSNMTARRCPKRQNGCPETCVVVHEGMACMRPVHTILVQITGGFSQNIQGADFSRGRATPGVMVSLCIILAVKRQLIST